MVNPLARVVMDNVAKTVQIQKNTNSYIKEDVYHLSEKEREIIKKLLNKSEEVSNLNINKKVVTLRQLADEVKGVIK
jgi:cell division protein FtsX